MIQANFSVTPLSGYVLATQFTVTNLTTSVNAIWKYIWDSGTGELIYNVTTPTFSYNYPGAYNISLTAIDYNNNSSVYSQQITTALAYKDYVTFTKIPDSYANPGTTTKTPFEISVISSNPSYPLNIDLYAANSLSTPVQFVPEKWKYLTPTNYFTDINSNIVTTLSVTPVPVYVNDVVVAVSGTAQFYYYDSRSTGQPSFNGPLLITATLQTNSFSTPYGSNIPGNGSVYSDVYPYPSYANNQAVRVGLLWQVNDLLPSLLKVTGNYINDIDQFQYNSIEIPVLVTYHGNRSYVLSGADNTTSEVLFSYPVTNTIGSQYPLTLSLSGISSNYYYTETAPLYVQQTDPNGAVIGGYVFTSLTSLTSVPHTSVLAQTTALNVLDTGNAFPYPQGYAPNTSVWISNPEQNTINKITVVPYPSNVPSINSFITSRSLIDGYVKRVSVPASQNTTTFNYNMSGFSGIYGIAIDPRDYSVVAADAETDTLYRFTNTGELTASFSLSSIDGGNSSLSAYTPASVSLDSNSNVWVSLFNDINVIKFDTNFNLLTSTNPSSLLNIDATAINDGDYLLKPPTLETDRDNNCWVTYSYSLCSLLVKYDSIGTPIAVITLPDNSVPVALAIDPNNNVWVSNSYDVLAAPGNIQLYNGTTYTLMSSITGIPRPGELCFNRNGGLWFTHSVRGIGYLDTNSNALSLYYNDPSNNTTNNACFVRLTSVDTAIDDQSLTYTFSWTTSTYTITGSDLYLYDEDFTGLAVDVHNRLWIVDAPYNTTFILPSATTQSITFNSITNPSNETDTPTYNTVINSNINVNVSDSVFRKIAILPNNNTGYYLDPNTSVTTAITGFFAYRSAQATGDWTGNRWYQKYTNSSSLSTVTLTGVSVPFTISNFENPYQIKRINESFNTAAYYKSLALPENLQENTNLFDKFFPAAVGTGYLSASEDMGQVAYERIANFVQNHSDIDTCLTDQLMNLANFVDITPSTYATFYPSEIKNMLDISSISKNRLLGIEDPIPLMPQSMGDKLDVATAYLTAGTSIVLQNRSDASTTIYQVPVQDNLTVYPLSSFDGYGFIQPVVLNYNFYQFVPVYSGNYINNIIDWNSDQTLLNPTLSTFEDWYKDNGIIENVFRYLLTKNLFHK